MLDAQVGGGEAELAAEFLAVRDLAIDDVGATEQAGGVFHVADGQGAPYAGAGNPLAIEGNAAHGLDGKAETARCLLQESVVTATTAPEAEVVTDDQVLDPAALNQHLFDKLIGRQGSKARIERANHGLRCAAIGEQFELFTNGAEAGGRRIRGKKFAGVRLEGQHHRRQPVLGGKCCQAPDQRGMPEMNAIEVTDGEHDRSRDGTRIAAKDAHG